MGSSEGGMTIDDLTEVYRVEKKSGAPSSVRSDLYPAMAQLLKDQRAEYDRLLREDPESLKCEGSNGRRKKGEQLSRDIVEMRMAKICKMALRGAMGELNSLETLTAEEKTYYENVLALSKAHKSQLDRLSGKIRYVNRELPEEPAAIPVPAAAEPTAEERHEPVVEIPVPSENTAVDIPEEEMAEVPLDMIPAEGIYDIEEVPETEIPDDDLDKMIPLEKEVPKTTDAEFILIRVLADMPTIAGPSRDYTLRKEQVVRMPTEFAQALINRGLAAKIAYSS